MGQNSSTDEEMSEDEGERFDIFGNLPPELQVQVCRWIIDDRFGVDTIGQMFEVNERWFHMMDTLPYSKSIPGHDKWQEVAIECDCIRTEIRRIQRDLHKSGPRFDEGGEKTLMAATEMYATHLMSTACKFKRTHQPLERKHLRSAMMADTDQSPEMTASVYGPDAVVERRKRRRQLLESIPIPNQ